MPEDVAKYPAVHRDADGQFASWRVWLSIIAYNTSLVKPEDAPKGFADLLDHPGQGEHNRCPHNEDEQGKNQIIKVHTFPGLVIHLPVQQPGHTVRPALVQRVNQFLAPNDPKHVETSQRIQRQEATRSYGRRGRQCCCARREGFGAHGNDTSLASPTRQ